MESKAAGVLPGLAKPWVLKYAWESESLLSARFNGK